MTDEEKEDWNKGIDRQYLGGGGFCGYCGEACKPFNKLLPKDLQAYLIRQSINRVF